MVEWGVSFQSEMMVYELLLQVQPTLLMMKSVQLDKSTGESIGHIALRCLQAVM